MYSKKRAGFLVLGTIFLFVIIPSAFALLEGLYWAAYSIPDLVGLYQQYSSFIDFMFFFALIAGVTRLSLAKFFNKEEGGSLLGSKEENPAFKLVYVSLGAICSLSLVIYNRYYYGGYGLIPMLAPYLTVILIFMALIILYRFIRGGENKSTYTIGTIIFLLLAAFLLANIFLPDIFQPVLGGILNDSLYSFLFILAALWSLVSLVRWLWSRKESPREDGTPSTPRGSSSGYIDTSRGRGDREREPSAETPRAARAIRVILRIEPPRGPYVRGNPVRLTAIVERRRWNLWWRTANGNFRYQWEIDGSARPDLNSNRVTVLITDAMTPNPTQTVLIRVTVSDLDNEGIANQDAITIECVQAGPTPPVVPPLPAATYEVVLRRTAPTPGTPETITTPAYTMTGNAAVGEVYEFRPRIVGTPATPLEIEVDPTTVNPGEFIPFNTATGIAGLRINGSPDKVITCNFVRPRSLIRFRGRRVEHSIVINISTAGAPPPPTGAIRITNVTPNSARQNSGVIALRVIGTGLDLVTSYNFPYHANPTDPPLNIVSSGPTTQTPTLLEFDINVSTDHTGAPTNLGEYGIHLDDGGANNADLPVCFRILPSAGPTPAPTLTVTNTVTGDTLPNLPPSSSYHGPLNAVVGEIIEFIPNFISGAYTLALTKRTGLTSGENITPAGPNFNFTPKTKGKKKIEFTFTPAAGGARQIIKIEIEVAAAPPLTLPTLTVENSTSGDTLNDLQPASAYHSPLPAIVGDTIEFVPDLASGIYNAPTVTKRTGLTAGENISPSGSNFILSTLTPGEKKIEFTFTTVAAGNPPQIIKIQINAIPQPVITAENIDTVTNYGTGNATTPVSGASEQGQTVRFTLDTLPSGDIDQYKKPVKIITSIPTPEKPRPVSGSSTEFDSLFASPGMKIIRFEFEDKRTPRGKVTVEAGIDVKAPLSTSILIKNPVENAPSQSSPPIIYYGTDINFKSQLVNVNPADVTWEILDNHVSAYTAGKKLGNGENFVHRFTKGSLFGGGTSAGPHTIFATAYIGSIRQAGDFIWVIIEEQPPEPKLEIVNSTMPSTLVPLGISKPGTPVNTNAFIKDIVRFTPLPAGIESHYTITTSGDAPPDILHDLDAAKGIKELNLESGGLKTIKYTFTPKSIASGLAPVEIETNILVPSTKLATSVDFEIEVVKIGGGSEKVKPTDLNKKINAEVGDKFRITANVNPPDNITDYNVTPEARRFSSGEYNKISDTQVELELKTLGDKKKLEFILRDKSRAGTGVSVSVTFVTTLKKPSDPVIRVWDMTLGSPGTSLGLADVGTPFAKDISINSLINFELTAVIPADITKYKLKKIKKNGLKGSEDVIPVGANAYALRVLSESLKTIDFHLEDPLGIEHKISMILNATNSPIAKLEVIKIEGTTKTPLIIADKDFQLDAPEAATYGFGAVIENGNIAEYEIKMTSDNRPFIFDSTKKSATLRWSMPPSGNTRNVKCEFTHIPTSTVLTPIIATIKIMPKVVTSAPTFTLKISDAAHNLIGADTKSFKINLDMHDTYYLQPEITGASLDDYNISWARVPATRDDDYTEGLVGTAKIPTIQYIPITKGQKDITIIFTKKESTIPEKDIKVTITAVPNLNKIRARIEKEMPDFQIWANKKYPKEAKKPYPDWIYLISYLKTKGISATKEGLTPREFNNKLTAPIWDAYRKKP